MTRRILLAPLLGVCLLASDCPENAVSPQPALGSITGTVMIEGVATAGVTVALSGATTAITTTGSEGSFSFSEVPAGTYVVEISGLPADATFPQTAKTATISTDGQTATVDFSGSFIRTSGITGTVQVSGMSMDDVPVQLSGDVEASTTTSGGGNYSFTGLRGGDYTVGITNPDPENYRFSKTEESISLDTDETKTVDFGGQLIAEAKITGKVSVDGQGLEGVEVTDEGPTGKIISVTDPEGLFIMDPVAPGEHTLSIDGFDMDRYEFSETSKTATAVNGETTTVDFQGSEKALVTVTPTALEQDHTVYQTSCPQTVGTITLTNQSNETVYWGAGVDDSALDFSPQSGSLEPGQSVEVTVEFNCNTQQSFVGNVSFSVATANEGRTEEHKVQVTMNISGE